MATAIKRVWPLYALSSTALAFVLRLAFEVRSFTSLFSPSRIARVFRVSSRVWAVPRARGAWPRFDCTFTAISIVSLWPNPLVYCQRPERPKQPENRWNSPERQKLKIKARPCPRPQSPRHHRLSPPRRRRPRPHPPAGTA